MIEKLSKQRIAEETIKLAGEFTPSLVPGDPVSEEIQGNYLRMYQTIDTLGKERAGERFHSRVFYLDGRPLYLASNQPVSLQSPRFDTLSIVHGDTVAGSPESIKKAHIENGYIYGPGTGDMKWAAIAGVETIAHAPKDSHTGLLVYPTEEIGGQDIEELREKGFFDNTDVVLCADGAPVEQGTVSIVQGAKGGVRMHVTTPPITSVHAAKVHTLEAMHPVEQLSEFITDTMRSIRQENKRRQEIDPDPWKKITLNPNYHAGEHPGKTPESAGVVFDIRAGTPADIAYAKEFMQRQTEKHGLLPDIFLEFSPYTPQLDNPRVKLYGELAKQVSGEENVIYTKDYGNADVRHLPATTTPILTGVRGYNWHNEKESVSLDAIEATIKTHVLFVQSR